MVASLFFGSTPAETYYVVRRFTNITTIASLLCGTVGINNAKANGEYLCLSYTFTFTRTGEQELMSVPKTQLVVRMH